MRARQGRPAQPNKPHGALWLSPIHFDDDGRAAGSAWTDFCQHGGLRTNEEVTVTPVAVAAEARIVQLSTRAGYDALATKVGLVRPGNPFDDAHLDWENARRHVDAIWLTEQGVTELADTHGPLAGWDTPGMVILNPAIVRASPLQSVQVTVTQPPRTPAAPNTTPPGTTAEASNFIRRARQVALEMEAEGRFSSSAQRPPVAPPATAPVPAAELAAAERSLRTAGGRRRR